MSAKLRLNKNALREQRQELRLYREFLPTLELRKQRLQTALREIEARRERLGRARQALRERAEAWAPMLRHRWPRVERFARVDQVVTHEGSIAGVAVPVFEAVHFGPETPSLLLTPPSFDDAIELRRERARHQAEAEVMDTQYERVEQELRRTTQRINLYDEVLIPRAKNNIRRLRVYLGDQQTAAVCRAKIAKGKILAKSNAAARGGLDGRR
ncbi:MAG: V-type ATP synthase subunit D [Myxococcota bacterium]